jgi:hypothetical protein
MRNLRYILLCSVFLIFGCATIPEIRVGQPWIRYLNSTENIPAGAKVKIDVTGNTMPLLGSEDLISEKLRDKIIYLMKRRGFLVDLSSYDYFLRCYYKTERVEKFKLSSYFSTASSNISALATKAVSASAFGLGVIAARTISAFSSSSATSSSQVVEKAVAFTHTISIDILDKTGKLVWKGESTWDSEVLDLINRIVPALQLILSDLPSDRSFKPKVSEVKNTHTQNYYRLECRNTWFACPALPYRIRFEGRYSTAENSSLPTSISDPIALAAYVDLIQTAEYALPEGDESDWKNPLDISLWKNVTLGGQYLLGQESTPVNVLVKLTGRSEGYYIDKCWLATDGDYSKFQEKLSKWQEALSYYYDVYVH